MTQVLARTAAIAFTLTSMVACGGGQLIEAEPQKGEAPGALSLMGPDAYRDFPGARVDANAPFTLDTIGVGVRGVEVVVRLDQVKSTSWTEGGEEDQHGTAYIVVERGTDKKTVRVAGGETKTVLGATISVEEAKIAYDDARARWLPVARVTVSAAP